MEDNVNFDNEVLAYLSVRKVPLAILILHLGSTDWEPQDVHSESSWDKGGVERLSVISASSQASKQIQM